MTSLQTGLASANNKSEHWVKAKNHVATDAICCSICYCVSPCSKAPGNTRVINASSAASETMYV